MRGLLQEEDKNEYKGHWKKVRVGPTELCAKNQKRKVQACVYTETEQFLKAEGRQMQNGPWAPPRDDTENYSYRNLDSQRPAS